MQAVMHAEPEVMIHELTGLAGIKSLKNFDREFVLTNRLRTEGTDHLLEGARAAGTRRVIAQSHGNWSYERTGTGLKTEEDPLDSDPPANQVKSLEAIRYLEHGVREADGSRASRCATPTSTVRAPASPSRATSSARCASASSRSSGTAAACGHSCTSTTQLRPQ